MSALLPAALLLLFSAWCGTFDGAAHGLRSVVAHTALLVVLALAGRTDPLRLGRLGNALLVMLAAGLAASFLLSPVRRAGLVGLCLLPAFLMVPPMVERCWGGAGERRRGLLGVSALVAAVAVWSLAGWWWLETPGASLPLGHHNLLAAWLVALLPLAVLPWREGGAARCLAGAAGALALAALAATRSFSGMVALLAMLAALALRRRARWWIAVAVLVAALAAWPEFRARSLALATGGDVSAAARLGYLEGAWRALAERPLLGWGPGSTSWTLGLFLRPQPGVHPPGQVVADPHSLPARLLYENGLLVVVLALALGCAVVRERRRAETADAALAGASALGLLGFAVASLAGSSFAAPALPLAAMMLIGALQASEPPRAPARRRPLWLAPAALLALVLAPLDYAHLTYDRARAAPLDPTGAELLERAVALDPGFPLYRARLALARRDLGEPGAAAEALEAAEAARGIAPFYLLAGVAGGEPGPGPAVSALIRACELDPLGGLAPFHLATRAGDDPRAPAWAARFLLAEPYLAAAEELEGQSTLLAAALAELSRLEALDPAWTARLARVLARGPSSPGPARRLALEMDAEGATSLSLHAFRRSPWPARIDEVRVLSERLPDLEAPAKSPTTDAILFRADGCLLPSLP